MVPLQRKVSKGSAPKKTAQTRAISATTMVTTTADAAGVSLRPVRLIARPGLASRATAYRRREAPTTHARQHAKALTAAPRVTVSPTHEAM